MNEFSLYTSVREGFVEKGSIWLIPCNGKIQLRVSSGFTPEFLPNQ